MTWTNISATRDLPPGGLRAVAVGDDEWVVWRTGDGELGVAPRVCPHLDSDLADATVVGEELVCPTHGWCFRADGQAGKRNLVGRFDAKDNLDVPAVREHFGNIELEV